MNYKRAIICGVFVWSCVSISFYILEKIPVTKNNFFLQTLIVMIGIIFYALLAASFYYKKKYNTNGIAIAIIISLTALLLDAFITVPFMELPNGRTYQSFFSAPALWLLAFTNAVTVYFYWRIKVKNKSRIKS